MDAATLTDGDEAMTMANADHDVADGEHAGAGAAIEEGGVRN